MRTASVLLVGAVAVGLAAGCKSDDGVMKPPVDVPSPTPPAMMSGDLVLEVETFALDEAKVKDLAGAGGGKAVLFDNETASAQKTVAMVKKGTYEVVVFTQGTDSDHDAFYLAVGDDEYRLFPDEYGKVVPTKAVTVVLSKDGPCKFVLMAAETDVYLDRIIVKKVK